MVRRTVDHSPCQLARTFSPTWCGWLHHILQQLEPFFHSCCWESRLEEEENLKVDAQGCALHVYICGDHTDLQGLVSTWSMASFGLHALTELQMWHACTSAPLRLPSAGKAMLDLGHQGLASLFPGPQVGGGPHPLPGSRVSYHLGSEASSGHYRTVLWRRQWELLSPLAELHATWGSWRGLLAGRWIPHPDGRGESAQHHSWPLDQWQLACTMAWPPGHQHPGGQSQPLSSAGREMHHVRQAGHGTWTPTSRLYTAHGGTKLVTWLRSVQWASFQSAPNQMVCLSALLQYWPQMRTTAARAWSNFQSCIWCCGPSNRSRLEPLPLLAC